MEVLQRESHKLASSVQRPGQTEEYQQNVKLFIRSVEQEVSDLIQKYEHQIK